MPGWTGESGACLSLELSVAREPPLSRRSSRPAGANFSHRRASLQRGIGDRDRHINAGAYSSFEVSSISGGTSGGPQKYHRGLDGAPSHCRSVAANIVRSVRTPEVRVPLSRTGGRKADRNREVTHGTKSGSARSDPETDAVFAVARHPCFSARGLHSAGQSVAGRMGFWHRR